MKKIRVIIYGFMLSLVCSCIQEIPVKKEIKLNPELEKFSWLIGTWSSVNDKTLYQETWTKINNFTLSGNAFMLSKTDTLFTEKLQIIFLDKEIFYIATVKDQNNSLPVRFRLTKNERGLHIFENPSHDFPQKIIYFMKSGNQLLAIASGVVDGKFRKENFLLNRINFSKSLK